MEFHGLDITSPVNRIKAGFCALAVNCRRYLAGGFALRNPLSGALYTLSAVVQSIARMNTIGGYLIFGADSSGNLYSSGTQVVTGLSGNKVSLVPFQPNQSTQAVMYVGDSAAAGSVTVTGPFTCSGMVKVLPNNVSRKMGIMEPQAPPIVGINTVNVTQWLTLPANTPPWTNIGGVNANYNYSGSDTQPPYPATISTPVVGSTVTLTVTGTATVNGTPGTTPGASQPSSAGYPGDFIASPVTVVFAFTDLSGNIVAQITGGVPPVVGNVGASATLTVPQGALQLQIGIDSQGGHFAANSGSYLVEAVVSTSAITQVVSIVGLINAYVWGDSPHSGPVATYIWKNPNDSGTGISRTIGTAAATSSNNSLIFDSSPEDGTVPVLWSTLNSAGSTIGSINLFSPALESDGYQDFNAAIVGSLFFPAGGTYAVQIQCKDQVMFGMGAGATSSAGTVYGTMGQAITVANGLPLMYVTSINGAGGQQTFNFTINVPEMGIVPFEFNWDYWYHTGRSMIVEIAPTAGAGVALVPPLPVGVRTGVQYYGKYRAAETGAQSNPGPPSPIQQTPVLANTIQQPYSPDPQVTKWDCYRQDSGLPNPTYVATGPNDGLGGTINGIVYNTAIEDTLSDVAAADNDIMEVDDFEPFPSLDSPKAGIVTIVAGVVTWKSGDQFNTRWLPGTLMLIGSPTQNSYSLVARPISATQIVIPDVPDTIGDSAGDGVPYNIAQPILAQTPVPYLFGPTDNIPYMCGVTGTDGVFRWCKGNNLDSAPDTNQQNLTDPSEILVNGAMSGGYGIVFSIKRAWIVSPNSQNAEATATGTAGSTWTFRSTSISRGLFIPRCLAVEGSGKTLFRVDDGIHFSQYGQGSQSITDETLYPLFPHEGSTPVAIVRNGYTIYPPDDTKPQFQQFSIQGNMLYYPYMGIDGAYHTLTFDIMAMAWVWDVLTPTATCYASNQGVSTQGVLVGCSDHTIRQFSSSGTETVNGVVVTPAIGGSGYQHLYQLTVEYKSSSTVTLGFVAADSGNGSYAPSPVTLPIALTPTKYTTNVSPNKWQWLQFSFTSTDPALNVYLDGFVVDRKDWGSSGGYQPVQPFAPSGGGGGET